MIDPVQFQSKFLRRRLWAKQREAVRAIRTHRNVAIKGCHGSGKTYAISGVVPEELVCHKNALVLVVAPTLRQVKTFWGEIAQAVHALPFPTPEPTTVKWDLGGKDETRYAMGFSSSKGVNVQGFHADRVTILADEAIGIGSDLWDAIEGIRMAGDVRIVKMCNPTVPSGPVFEDFTKNRALPGHKCITISAFDTPNLAGLTMESLLQLSEEELDYAPFPYLTRRRAVKELYYKWGPTNPRFQSRVLGEFPTQASDSVYQLGWIEKAALPYEPEELAKVLLVGGVFIQVGLDIAGPGDDETAITARIGQYVIAAAAWAKPDPLEEVLGFLNDLRTKYPGARILVVGDTVGTGFHFVRSIARHRFDVFAFIAQAAPLDPIMFKNAKAEAHWALREWMRDGLVHGIADEDTKAQLSDIKYSENARGQIEIEHKDDMRARGARSPDRAESLIMAFCRIVIGRQDIQVGGANTYQISAV